MSFKKLINPNTDENTQSSPSADEFEQMLQASFGTADRKLSVGERIRAEVLSVGKENVIVSTGTRFDGFVTADQLHNEKGESTVKAGDVVELFVTFIKGSQIFLSPKATSKNLAEDLNEAFTQDRPIEGRVEAVNKGGFEVLVMGKMGFCPMGQMDLKRIEKPEEYIGKKLQFRITQFSEGGRNVVLSRRKIMEEDQGVALASFKGQRQVGEKVTGKVTKLENFGAFVEIAPGLEALAHISELSWTRVKHPSDVLKVGDIVNAEILKMESEGSRLKISLTLKQSANDPWNNLPSTIQSGRVVMGKVTRLAPFGAFVELTAGVDGLVPLSEMSSTKRVASAEEVVKVGEAVTVLVKEINPSARRISLSLKGAVDQAASMSEEQDIQEYRASEKARATASSGGMGDLGAKLQAAMKKKGS